MDLGKEEQEAFERLKDLLYTDNVLAHHNPSLELGISCDASEVGIGAVCKITHCELALVSPRLV